MATMRYEPWTVVSRLQNEINRVFGNLNETGQTDSATAEWSPAVDVREYGDRFELLVDLPGVDPKAVEITLDAGVLSLSGERRDEKTAGEEAQQSRSERMLGRFYRRFILPDTVDTEQVKASGRNGVLQIVIAKQPKVQPRRITVS